MTELTEKDYDAIVEKITEPVRDLDATEATMLLMHAGFAAHVNYSVWNGTTDPEEIKQNLVKAFEAFLTANPLPSRH